MTIANVTVDQQRLILNAFAAIFQNNLTAAELITWKKFDGEMNDRNALTVVEQVGPRYSITRNSSSVNDLSGGVQDSTFGSEQYQLTEVWGSSMGWGDFVKIRDINEARESEALKNAAINLAEVLDGYILGFVSAQSNNWLGDGTTAVSLYDHIASGYTRLKEEGVDDMDFRAVLSYQDRQSLGSAIVSNNASLMELGEGTYRKGFTGEVDDIPVLFTQQLQPFTVGSRVATGTSLTNYASGDPTNTYASVCKSPAPGQYLTGLLQIDGQSGAVTIKEGEVFTIAGVYAYDNRAKKQLNHLQQFRVVGGTGSDGTNAGVYTASSGAFANVRYFPAIIVSGANQTVVNTNGGGATWDELAITHLGAASATLSPRVITQKSAIVGHTMDLIMPATGKAVRKALTKVPLSVRMWQDSIFATGDHRIRFDVAFNCNVVANGRPRIVRINGS